MKRSDEKNKFQYIEKKKIVFQFFLVSIFSFIAGVLFVNLASDEFLSDIARSLEINTNIDEDFLYSVLKNALSDISVVIILYIFSFSFINYLISDFVLAFWGFKTGLYVYTYFLSNIRYVKLFALISIKIALLAVVLLFACSLGIKSLSLVRYRPNSRIRIDKKCLVSITILTVSTIGAIIVLNAIGLLI